MKIWVVVDVDNVKAVKAFCGEDAEERASDYADVYYSKTGFDCRYDEVALLKNIWKEKLKWFIILIKPERQHKKILSVL